MDSFRKEKPQKRASSRHGTVKVQTKRNEEGSGPEMPAAKTRKRDVPAGVCPLHKKCGGCDYQGVSYREQLRLKNEKMHSLLDSVVQTVHPIIGMKEPEHYRCKVNAVFSHDRKGNPVSGNYEKNSHRVVPVESCMIQDEKADAIIGDIRSMLRSFRIRTYDEDTGYGLLRHVQVRRGYATGEYMVTLVCADPVFPSKNNFVKALRKKHPEISTIILNINDKSTSMVLGERNITLYGRGFIEDELCGCRFRISPGSFYQVNPPQTQILYETALGYAHLTGKESVLDAYCGTGTIGIIASKQAKSVSGVELNRDAVRDAIWNARRNDVKNIRFINKDAGDYMDELPVMNKLSAGSSFSAGNHRSEEATEVGTGVIPDVVILDPPRTGTTQKFIDAVCRIRPDRIVYVSCGPDTLARDLKLFRKRGYKAQEAQPVDLFPFTEHVETVVLLSRSVDSLV